MHDVLSRAGKAHATTGLAITAQQLGVTTKEKPDGDECQRISLGPVGTQYYVRKRDQLGAFEAVVSAYLEAAVKAQLRWPTSDTPFLIFADSVFRLMTTCHAEQRGNYVGLIGGKTLAKTVERIARRTPRSGTFSHCSPVGRTPKSGPTQGCQP